MPDAVVIGGLPRLALSLACFAAALALASAGFGLGWGIGWMAWVPAVALLLPAAALAGRRRIVRADGTLTIEDGRLFRRIYELPVAGGELEVLPAGGAWAVVLHRGGAEFALASWVGRATAERVAAILPDLPRRQPRRPQADR